MKMMVDIDHGDVSSPDPADTRPLCLGGDIRVAVADHPHQAVVDEQGRALAIHRRAQRAGRIMPEKLLDTIRAGGGTEQRNLPGALLP